MRALRLAQIAAEAEALRLRRIARRTVFRAVYAVLALFFVVAALGVVHVFGWLELVRFVTPISATLILIGVDLLIAVIFGILAASAGPGRIEKEALQIRNTAVQQAKRSFGVLMLLAPVSRAARSRGFLGRIFSAATDVVLRR